MKPGSPNHSYILQKPALLTHEQTKIITNKSAANRSNVEDQGDHQNVSQEPIKTRSNKQRPEMLDQHDLLEYMYQHVQFDEIPFDHDPLYDHRQIYSHETAYIPYGIYKDIQESVAFEIEIEKEKEKIQIQDKNTAYMHNVGRPILTNDSMCHNEVCKEVYTNEQNEILRMNIENTRRNMENEEKEENENENTYNRDMSQEAPIIPVYMPIVDEHHGVMFANSSKSLKREHYQHVTGNKQRNDTKGSKENEKQRNNTNENEENENEENENEENENQENENEENEKQYCLHSVNDAETFQYKERIEGENIPMVEATYFTTQNAQKVLFDGELYAVINYNEGGHLTAIYKNVLEIPTAINNGANVNVLPKAFYDQHPEFHELPKVKANMQPIMTGNGPIPAYFWTDIPITIQGVSIQLRCIVCDSTAAYGLLLSRLVLDQLQAIQLYDKKQVLVKMNAIPLRSTQGLSIAPNNSQNHNQRNLL